MNLLYLLIAWTDAIWPCDKNKFFTSISSCRFENTIDFIIFRFFNSAQTLKKSFLLINPLESLTSQKKIRKTIQFFLTVYKTIFPEIILSDPKISKDCPFKFHKIWLFKGQIYSSRTIIFLIPWYCSLDIFLYCRIVSFCALG